MQFLKNKKFFIVSLIFVIVIMVGFWITSSPKSERQNITNLDQEKNIIGGQVSTSSQNEIKGLNIYHNEEWGFEFEYPGNWLFEVKKALPLSSKFTLRGDISAEHYNPFSPLFIVNIVTPDFADRAFVNLNETASQVKVAGVIGLQYEYEYEGLDKIAVVLPFGQYKMLIGGNKDQGDVFNQILSTFKFIEK